MMVRAGGCDLVIDRVLSPLPAVLGYGSDECADIVFGRPIGVESREVVISDPFSTSLVVSNEFAVEVSDFE